MLTLWSTAIQTLQQVLCFRQIGIEFQHAQNIIACTIGLPSLAKHPSDIHSDGTVNTTDIATDTNVQIPAATVTAAITLVAGKYALISETFADVSSVSVFSVFKPPVIYYRTIT